VKEDPMWLSWQEAAENIFEKTYYSTNPLVAYVNNSGHRIAENGISIDAYYSRVLEIGAGTGYHLGFVRHRYDKYIMSDINEKMIRIAEAKYINRRDLEYRIEDASNLSLPDNSIDRIISIYNLEHIPSPHLVLKEWRRVVRLGGLITIAITAEGGIAWRLGRYFTTRRTFARYGLNLDYIIAREHINTCYNLVALIRYYFESHKEVWFPFKIPITDINLIYVCQINV